MNIFVLSKDPVEAAKMQCDKHVPKMVLESTQMLCLGIPRHLSPYKHAYQHHPCSKWALESSANYEWLLKHAIALADEYFLRFNKTHSCAKVLWIIRIYRRAYQVFTEHDLTPFALAMPDRCKDPDPIKAYRNYYLDDKAYFAKWIKGREAPEWWVNKYEVAIEALNRGEKHKMTVHGPSMKPLIESGSNLTFQKTDDYQVDDVVMTKVKGNWMVHKITKVGADGRYMISNNKGRDNGWTRKIYGRVVAKDNKPFGRKVKNGSK
jgi:hypothetical protein